MVELEELTLKLTQCNELIDEAAGYELDMAKNSEISRNLPDRKSFRAKQKTEIDWYEADILRLETENLKLVEKIDVLDGQTENLEKDCIEYENKIAKASEDLRELKESGLKAEKLVRIKKLTI